MMKKNFFKTIIVSLTFILSNNIFAYQDDYLDCYLDFVECEIDAEEPLLAYAVIEGVDQLTAVMKYINNLKECVNKLEKCAN